MKVQESPEWLKERLVAVGLRPINNIVDITNFVLHELGTPLHAFDAAKVQGGIVTRTAYEGETIKALDGQEYTLNCTDLVVADQSGNALAIGGVMEWGGKRRDGRHYGYHSGVRLVQALLRPRHVPQAGPVLRLFLPL